MRIALALAALLLACAPAAQTRYDTRLQSGHWSVITHNGRLALAHIQIGSNSPALEQWGPELVPGLTPVALDHQMTIVVDNRECAIGASVLWSVNGQCSEHILGNIPASGMFTTNRPFTIQTGKCGRAHIYSRVVGYNNPAMLPRCPGLTRPPDVVFSVFEVRLR